MTSSAEIDDAKEQEIFEFPWVVFDVQSKQVVDEKTLYVKPTIHESLGAQCAEVALGDDAASCMESAGTLQQAVQVACHLSRQCICGGRGLKQCTCSCTEFCDACAGIQ